MIHGILILIQNDFQTSFQLLVTFYPVLKVLICNINAVGHFFFHFLLFLLRGQVSIVKSVRSVTMATLLLEHVDNVRVTRRELSTRRVLLMTAKSSVFIVTKVTPARCVTSKSMILRIALKTLSAMSDF